MTDQETRNLLHQVADSYVRSRGEPPLRDQVSLIQDAIALIDRATQMLESAQRIMSMSDIFRNKHFDPSIPSEAWDELVLDYSTDELDVVRALFPEAEWPNSIPYPNLVALVGHIDQDVAVDRATAMVASANALALHSSRLVASHFRTIRACTERS